MNMRCRGLMFYLLILTLAPVLSEAGQIRYAVFTAPPYMIDTEQPDDAKISGIDVEIIRKIATEMRLDIIFVRCAWKRCLHEMKTGRTDILSSVYKKPERELFLNYLDAPYLTHLPISFYYKKGNPITITRYADLYAYKDIGVLRGASYFEKFDRDNRLSKYEVSHQSQLLQLVAAGRIPLMAGYIPTVNYRLFSEGFGDQIRKAVYTYNEPASVYIVISKNSPFAGRLQEFNQIHRRLLESGVIESIKTKYYNKYKFDERLPTLNAQE